MKQQQSFIACLIYVRGFPGSTVVKNLPANEGDTIDEDSVHGLEGSPGGGNDSPLQYSCLENSMDRGVWQAVVHRVAKSQTQLSTHIYALCVRHLLV